MTEGEEERALSPSHYSLKRKTRMQGITPGNQEMPACGQTAPIGLVLNMATFKRISDNNQPTRLMHSLKAHFGHV